MATIPELEAALINADKAGDSSGAKILASEIIKMREATPSAQTPQLPTDDLPTGELPPEQPSPTMGERVVGAGEAALAIGTGATSGALGYIGGALKGLAQQILSGEYGTRKGGAILEKSAQEGAQALTYEPRTETGKEYTQTATETIAPLEALTPIAAEIGAVARTAKTAIPSIKKAIPIVSEKAPLKKMTQSEVGEVAKKAASGSTSAKVKLAEEAKINIDAMKAADRLEIDLPTDVWSDSELIKQTAGLTRSQIGTESAAWKEYVTRAASKADEAMQKLGGAESKATISEKTQDMLSKSRSDLKTNASALYNEVDANIPKSEQVQATNTLDTLKQIAGDLGGTEGMTSQEKSLLSMISSTEGTTYGRLIREKQMIGKALQGKESPYGNIDEASLKRLYGALASDQLDNVESMGGTELRNKLHFANRLTSKQKELEKRMIKAYGKDGEGSISTLMTRAIEQGSKGDITPLNKLLKAVPEELHKEVMATALTDIVSSARGAEPGIFDFAKFSKLYHGLRKNTPVYNKLIKTLGVEHDKMLNDLFKVSKAVTEARANVIQTGKANQAILKSLQSENLASSIAKSIVDRGVKAGSLGTVSIDNFVKSPADKIAAVGELFRSQEFKDLSIEAATKTPSYKSISRFAKSPAFNRWKQRTGVVIKEPEFWILNAMAQQEEIKSQQGEQE